MRTRTSSGRGVAHLDVVAHLELRRVEDDRLHRDLLSSSRRLGDLHARARRWTASRCRRAGRSEPPSRPTPLILKPPKGASWLRCAVLMPTLPDAQPLGDGHRPRRVLREHVVVQAELGAVGERDRLVLVVEGEHDDDRAEDLLLHRLHVGPAVGEQRRARRRSPVVDVGPLAAGDDGRRPRRAPTAT